MRALLKLALSVVCLAVLSFFGIELTQYAENTSGQSKIETYEDARRLLWSSLYPRGGNTLYCGQTFDSQRRKGFNVEHVFPMSWATNGLDCGTRKQCRRQSAEFNRIEADLHNLYPTRVDVNQQRSSFRFGEVQGEKRRFGKDCDFELDFRARVAEPAPTVRGDVARSMFYMAYTYQPQGLQLFEKQARLLLKWHQADPPSAAEKKRNDKIESLSGQRNVFIDEPEKAAQLMSERYFF